MMNFIKKCIWFLWLTPVTLFAIIPDHYAFSSIDEAKRFDNLTQEVRCLVCQNQNLADSNSPLANDLRDKIYGMVSDKKNNDEIKDYLVKRYGEYILFEPRYSKYTWLLWAFPWLAFFFAFWILARKMRRQDT